MSNDQVELKRKSVIDKLKEHSEEIAIRTVKDTKYGTVIVRTATPVIRLNKAMEIFEELEKKLEITEKALELAYEEHKKDSTPANWVYHVSKEEYMQYLETKAKEMKSE